MTQQPTTVFATEGGHRYHKSRACFAFNDGQHLWRFDPQQWVPGMPQIMLSNGHSWREMSFVTALGQGKGPCAECFPGQRAALYQGNCENDYGHEPIEIDGDSFCARCRNHGFADGGDPWTHPTLWPCASAVVLGLVPRVATPAP